MTLDTNTIGLMTTAGFMITVTAVLMITAYFLFKAPKFSLVKALNIKHGVYQSRTTGNLVEIRSIDELNNTVYATDASGGWNIDVRVLDSTFIYVGSL